MSWEENCNEANQRKGLKYTDLMEDFREKGWIFFIIIRLGLNVALTHQNRSYRDNQGKRRGIEKESERGKRQEEDSYN